MSRLSLFSQLTSDPHGAITLSRRLLTDHGVRNWRRYALAFALQPEAHEAGLLGEPADDQEGARARQRAADRVIAERIQADVANAGNVVVDLSVA